MTTPAMLGIKKPITLPFVRVLPDYSEGYSLEELTGISGGNSKWFLAPVNSFIPDGVATIHWIVDHFKGVQCRVISYDKPAYNAYLTGDSEIFELVFIAEVHCGECRYFPTPPEDYEHQVLVTLQDGGKALLIPSCGEWTLICIQSNEYYSLGEKELLSHQSAVDFLVKEAVSWSPLIMEPAHVKPVAGGTLRW